MTKHDAVSVALKILGVYVIFEDLQVVQLYLVFVAQALRGPSSLGMAFGAGVLVVAPSWRRCVAPIILISSDNTKTLV